MNLLARTRGGFPRLQRAFGRQVEMPSVSELGDWCRGLVEAPERWSGPHRLFVAVAVASAAFALGVQGSRALGLHSNATTDGASLAELTRRLDDARTKASALPALRQAVETLPAPTAKADSTRPVGWQSVATLAMRSGMALQSVEPGERVAGGLEAGHIVRFEAKSSFASFVAFLSALSTLPMLVVPAELVLEREASGLRLRAELRIHDSLPGLRAAEADDVPGAFADPFGAPPPLAPVPTSEVRLTGLMIEGVRSLALIEADGRGAVYLPGQMLGNERLVRIGSASVTLAHETGTRVLTIGADS